MGGGVRTSQLIKGGESRHFRISPKNSLVDFDPMEHNWAALSHDLGVIWDTLVYIVGPPTKCCRDLLTGVHLAHNDIKYLSILEL